MGIVEELKTVVGLVRQIDNIELYQKIIELQVQVLEIVEDNLQLRDEIRSAGRVAQIEDSLTFDSDCYWRWFEESERQGPYCSSCWDTERQLVRLHYCGDPRYSECPKCRKMVKVSRSK